MSVVTLCTDDGVGLLYRGEQFIEAVREREGARAHRVVRDPDTGDVLETPRPVRRLPEA